MWVELKAVQWVRPKEGRAEFTEHSRDRRAGHAPEQTGTETASQGMSPPSRAALGWPRAQLCPPSSSSTPSPREEQERPWLCAGRKTSLCYQHCSSTAPAWREVNPFPAKASTESCRSPGSGCTTLPPVWDHRSSSGPSSFLSCCPELEGEAWRRNVCAAPLENHREPVEHGLCSKGSQHLTSQSSWALGPECFSLY